MGTETTAFERNTSQRREEILREAKRIEESALYSCKGHYVAAGLWRGVHLFLGLPTTILASVVAAKAFSQVDAHHSWGGWISIAVAALSALSTFLNANAKAAAHFAGGNSYGALQDKARIFWTVDCWGDDSDQVLSRRLKDLSEEKAELNSKSPQIPLVAYLVAKRGIAGGEGDYKVDKPKA